MEYDLVVIGAGPGGYVSAIRAAQYGLKVAVVEKAQVGGTCLNRGCVPTKTLMHTSELYSELKHSESLGINAEVSYDIEKIYTRKDEVVEQLRNGIEFLLKSNKIDLVIGEAKIISENLVRVDEIKLETKNILIATGTTPALPQIQGIELEGVITSNELLDQKGTNYKSMTIIGGGVIGVEFASVFNALGCEVSIIEAMDRILPTMDIEISRNLNRILKKRGIKIFTSAIVQKIEKTDNLICHYKSKEKEHTIQSEIILVAIGRRANTDIFSEEVKVETKRGIVVDENFATSIKNIYAIGDVIDGGIQLAHMASAQGMNAVAKIAGKEEIVNLDVVPACIYTNPEIATVGITQDMAKKQSRKVKIGKFSMAGNAKTIIEQKDRGFIKIIFDEETKVILGAQLMCARATDIISELSTAIVNKLTIDELSSVIRPHPTFTEGVTEALESAIGLAIHIV